jgi:drug/metabolite transporter (DMT)-like permease
MDLESTSFIAILAGIASAAFYGSNIVMCKSLGNRGLEPREIAFLRMFLGGLFSLFFIFNTKTKGELLILEYTDVVLLLGVSYLTLVLGFDLFFSGLRYLEAGTTSILELVTPIVALSISIIFFNESINTVQIIAIPIFIYCILKLSQDREFPKQV